MAATLRSVSVTDAEVKAAKNALSLEWSECMHSNLKGEILAYSATHGFADLMSEKALLDAVAQVTLGDVQVIHLAIGGSRGADSALIIFDLFSYLIFKFS